MDNEIWKETKYKNYFVSNYGRVLSKGCKENIYRRNKDLILTPSDNGHGYLFVNINGKQVYVHRLVAEAFLNRPNNCNQINHKDENKRNNCVDNLEWCDGKYNVSYSIGIKIKQIDIKTKDVINIYASANQAAKAVNGRSSSILMCCKRIKYKTYKGYLWRFINDNDYYIKPDKMFVRIDPISKEETIYSSCKEAAYENGVSTDAIYACLYGKTKLCVGYVWIKR